MVRIWFSSKRSKTKEPVKGEKSYVNPGYAAGSSLLHQAVLSLVERFEIEPLSDFSAK